MNERDLAAEMADVRRELKQIRELTIEQLRYLRDAEKEVPESLRRFANYMHDVHDIKFMYEEHGHTVPEYINEELRRLDDRYRQILDAHNAGGGAIEKIRREMSGDPLNRWDHTKLLEKRKENSDEAGTSQ